MVFNHSFRRDVRHIAAGPSPFLRGTARPQRGYHTGRRKLCIRRRAPKPAGRSVGGRK